MRLIVRRLRFALIAFRLFQFWVWHFPLFRLAAEVGVPVEIDWTFAGTTFGTRTVNPLPAPHTSTTAPEPSPKTPDCIMTMGGDGNSAAGVELTSFVSDAGRLDQRRQYSHLLETNGIVRSNDNVPSDLALDVDIKVTNSNGVTGSFSTGISSTYAFDLVLNFYCTDNTVCFSGSPNFSSIKSVSVRFAFPENYIENSANHRVSHEHPDYSRRWFDPATAEPLVR